jgi:hypothetical protein
VESTSKPFETLMKELEKNLQRRLEISYSSVIESELDAYLDYEPSRVQVKVEKENGTQNEGLIIYVTVEQPDNDDKDVVSDVFNQVDNSMEELFTISERRFE